MPTVRERVRAGATLLDERVVGWAGKIDRQKLNLQLCTACVLGQMYGDYAEGCESMDLSEEQVVAFGFEQSLVLRPGPITEVEYRELKVSINAEYRELTACWLAEIAARLEPIDAAEDETLLSPIDTEACPL